MEVPHQDWEDCDRYCRYINLLVTWVSALSDLILIECNYHRADKSVI